VGRANRPAAARSARIKRLPAREIAASRSIREQAVAAREGSGPPAAKGSPGSAGGQVLDAQLQKLLRRWREYPGVRGLKPLLAPQGPVLPIVFRRGDQRFSYFSLITTVGTPQSITAQELRVECMFPTDVSDRSLRALFRGGNTKGRRLALPALRSGWFLALSTRERAAGTPLARTHGRARRC